jgi:hypothetical protein
MKKQDRMSLKAAHGVHLSEVLFGQLSIPVHVSGMLLAKRSFHDSVVSVYLFLRILLYTERYFGEGREFHHVRCEDIDKAQVMR